MRSWPRSYIQNAQMYHQFMKTNQIKMANVKQKNNEPNTHCDVRFEQICWVSAALNIYLAGTSLVLARPTDRVHYYIKKVYMCVCVCDVHTSGMPARRLTSMWTRNYTVVVAIARALAHVNQSKYTTDKSVHGNFSRTHTHTRNACEHISFGGRDAPPRI